MWLDIVVIGRNEESNLNRLRSSIKKSYKIVNQLIYVDSGSKDRSVSLANKFCDVVIELKEHEGLCASLGRRIGAIYAEKDWILFLDADMEITDEFHEWLSTFNKDTRSSGFVGKYKDIDKKNNRIKYRVYKNVNGIAKYFGGAILLNRAALFQSGNWASTIYSNEEIELYSRMIQKGFKVEIIEELMVNHYTEIPTIKESLLDLVLMKNKKLSLGPSQVLVKAIKEKYFKNLLYLQPLPYSLFFINVLTVLLIISNLKIALFWFVVAHVLVVIITRSVKVVCVAYISLYLIIMGLLLSYKKQGSTPKDVLDKY